MQKNNPLRKIYFDSCVFISHLQNGADRQSEGEKNSLISVGAEIREGKIHVITSTITFTEVIRKNGRSAINDFYEYLRSAPETTVVEPSDRICIKAGEIRLSYEVEDNEGQEKKMGTPDAIHLATAITYEVDTFFTFEKRLRRLNEKIEGLKIEKPSTPQMKLGV